MLIRIRTNVATWRIKVPDNSSLLELKKIIFDEYNIPIDQQEFEEISSDQGNEVLLSDIRPNGVQHGDLLCLKGRLQKQVVKTSYVGEDGVLIAAGTTLTKVVTDDDGNCQADEKGSDSKSSTTGGSTGGDLKSSSKITGHDIISGAKAPSSSSSSASSAAFQHGNDAGMAFATVHDEEYYDPQCVPDPMFDDFGSPEEMQIRPPDADKTETLLGDPVPDIAEEFARHLNSRISLSDVMGDSRVRHQAYQEASAQMRGDNLDAGNHRAIDADVAESMESFEDIMRQMGRGPNPLLSHLYDNSRNGDLNLHQGLGGTSIPPPPVQSSYDSDFSSHSTNPTDKAGSKAGGARALSPASRLSLKAAGLTDEEIDLSFAVHMPDTEKDTTSSSSSSDVTHSSHAGSSAKPYASLAQRKIVEKAVNLLPNPDDDVQRDTESSSTSYSFVNNRTSNSAASSINTGPGAASVAVHTWMDVDSDDNDDDDDVALAEALALSMQVAGAPTGSSEAKIGSGDLRVRTGSNSKSRSHSISSRQRVVNRMDENQMDLTADDDEGDDAGHFGNVGAVEVDEEDQETLEISMMKAELLSLGFSEEEVLEQVQAFKRHNVEFGRTPAPPTAVPAVAANSDSDPKSNSNSNCNSNAGGSAQSSAVERRNRIRDRIGYDPRSLDEDGAKPTRPLSPHTDADVDSY